MIASRAAGAQTLELPGNVEVHRAVAAADGGIWLQAQTLDSSSNRRESLIKISSSLTIELERPLPESFHVGLVTFGDGVLMIEREPRPENASSIRGFEDRYRLVWLADDSRAPAQTLFRWQSRESPSIAEHVAAALDASALYIAPSRRESASLTKIAPDGEVLWQRTLSDAPLQELIAVPEGLLAVHAGPMLAAWSADGDLLRETALDSTEIMSFVPPSTLVLATHAGSRDLYRLQMFDLAAGSKRSVTLPVTACDWNCGYGLAPARAHAGLGGLLLVGLALDNPWVGLIGTDGTVRWAQRVKLYAGARFAMDASRPNLHVLPLGADRIVLTASAYVDGRNRTQLIASDGDGLELAQNHGRCVESDAGPIVARRLEILDDFRIYVGLGMGSAPESSRPTDANGCALPSDAEYLAFLEAFADELALNGAVKLARNDELISGGVDMVDVPYRLTGYRYNVEITEAADTSIGFAASPAGATPLAQHLAQFVLPHMQRMRTAVTEAGRLTGCQVSVSGENAPPSGSAAVFYADIETAASIVVAEARRVMPEIRAEAEALPRRCYLDISRDAFGPYGEPRPLSEAGDTLREVLLRP